MVVRLDLPEKLNVSINLLEVKELLKDVDEDGSIKIYVVFHLLRVSLFARLTILLLSFTRATFAALRTN